jgi:hypothetical protein
MVRTASGVMRARRVMSRRPLNCIGSFAFKLFFMFTWDDFNRGGRTSAVLPPWTGKFFNVFILLVFRRLWVKPFF